MSEVAIQKLEIELQLVASNRVLSGVEFAFKHKVTQIT